MATTGTYFIDTSAFETATKIWTDNARTILAPDGYYSINNVYRRQLNGLLQAVNGCPEPPVTATVAMTPVSCFSGSDGTITVSSVSGGNGEPYFVKLNSGGTYESITTSKTYSSLTSDNYDVYVKDLYNNETIIGINVTQPTLNISSISVVDSQSLNGISSGGVWPKTYRLYQDTSSPYISGECGDTLITTLTGITESNATQLIEGLSSGYYCLEVTDANGCFVNSGLVELTAPTPTPTPTTAPTTNYLIEDCETGEYWNAQKTQTFDVGDVVEFLIKINREFIHCGTIINDNYSGVSDVTLYSAITRSCDDDIHCGVENPNFLLE